MGDFFIRTLGDGMAGCVEGLVAVGGKRFSVWAEKFGSESPAL